MLARGPGASCFYVIIRLIISVCFASRLPNLSIAGSLNTVGLQGNLLNDTALIGVLANTKQTAEEVNERLAGASATNRKLTEACEVRAVVSIHTSGSSEAPHNAAGLDAVAFMYIPGTCAVCKRASE